jgi:hypothetical protein
MADSSKRLSLAALAFANSRNGGELAPSLLGSMPLSSLSQHLVMGGYMSLASLLYPVKRRAFFSFHFDDNMRVNNVRLCQQFRADNPNAHGFTDSSLWEARQLDHPDSIKDLIRNGVQGTSVVCVLVGSQTWSRRWVRYEIARAVIDNRGLLAVHINGLKHTRTQLPDQKGPNPLCFMGVCQQAPGEFFLYELINVTNAPGMAMAWEWRRYEDYTRQVDLPSYLQAPPVGWVRPLSSGTLEYCFVAQSGHISIGAWIDRAAQAVGR